LAWDSILTYVESAVTATKNGGNIDIGPTGIVEAFVDVSAHTGGDTTLDVKFQESDDGSAFNDILEVPTFLAVGDDTAYFRTDKKYVRYVATVAGTSPSFDFTIRMR
jgi:hypothetical protein